mgnify:CR=1 FL=1
MNTEERHWFALYTRSRAEKKTCQALLDAGIEAFLPLSTKIKQWSDRKKKVQEPLIPSYVFVHSSEVLLVDSLKVQGVVGVLKHLGKPAIVKDHEIESLQILTDAQQEIKTISDYSFKKGDPITVVLGPFTGLKAEYIRYQGDYRVLVNIASMNSFFSVNIPLDFIETIQKQS